MRFTFDVVGEKQVDRTLARVADDITDARPLWDKLANDFGRIESAQFASQGAYSGGWPALSPRYAAWKSRHYPGKPILQRTGALHRDLTARPYGVERITGESMTVGTDLPYARYHQTGGGSLPRRRPVEFDEATRRRWVGIIQRYVMTGEA